VFRKGAAVAVAGVCVAVGVFTLDLVHGDPDSSFAGAGVLGRGALAAAGFALAAAGLAAWLRGGHRFGSLLVAGSLAWFLLEWIVPKNPSSLAFTTGLVLYACCFPLIGHAVLAFPSGRLDSAVERITVAGAYCVAAVVLGLLPTLVFDPAAGCNECPGNLLLVTGRDSIHDRLVRVGVWLGAASAAALAIVVVLRLVRASPTARRSRGLVLVAGAVYLGLVAATYATSIDRGLLWNGDLQRRLWVAQAVAIVGIVVGLVWSWIRARRGSSAVARLVLELAHSPPAGGLRDALAEIVGDPTLELAYPIEDAGRLVDTDGRPVVFAAGKEHTTLVGDGRALAVAAHAPGVLDDDQLVADVAAAARLVLENERLQAAVHARVDDLRASRARILEAGDAERQRLERDLHDGAQQRLVGLALSLRLLRSRLDSGAETPLGRSIAAADGDLHEAIEGLRRLAHGIFPAVLSDGGLSAAVVALAEDAPIPIHVESLPSDRYAPAVETAAYGLVAAAAAAATARVFVRAGRSDGRLVLEIDAGEIGNELEQTELDDRVSAAGGRLEVARPDGRVVIRAEFPCAS